MASVYTFKASPYSSHSLLLKALPSTGQGKRVLDVGCGDGFLATLLADRGFTVTGIERAEGHGPSFPANIHLVEADLEQGLPDLSGRFDYVLCADILEHLRRPEALLRQLRTILAPGGVLIASLPNSGNIWFRLNIVIGRFPLDDKGLFDRTHLRFYMWKGWNDLLREGGFRIIGVRSSAIPVSLVVPQSLEQSTAVRIAESVCYGLAQIHKTLFAYQFIVHAQPMEQR